VVEVIRREQVWVANLFSPRGREIGKQRPVLVIHADELTPVPTPLVVVLPLTAQVYPSFRYWRVTLKARDRLLRDCQVLVDQPRVLDRNRFGVGSLPPAPIQRQRHNNLNPISDVPY